MASPVPPVRMAGSLDPRGAWSATECPVANVLDALSTRTAFLILREAFYGATRFDEFVRRVGISEPVAAARLRQLVDHGLLARQPYQDPGSRTRQGYVLTEKGQEFLPTFVALMSLGDGRTWPDGGGRGSVELRHSGCGQPVTTEVRCSDGHLVEAGEIELVALHDRR